MSEAPCPPPREPTRPVIATPPNACDTHCHVFGPAAQLSLRGGPQLHAARRAAGKISRACSTRSASSAACWCRAARTAATMPRCSMRWSGIRTGCAASRSPTRHGRGGLRHLGCARRARACASIISSATGNCTIAAACRSRTRKSSRRPEGSRLAPAALDRREGPARHDPDPEGDRPAGGDRPHGPHRRAGRHRRAGLPGAAAPARRRRLLGEAVGRAPRQHRRRTIRTRARCTSRW